MLAMVLLVPNNLNRSIYAALKHFSCEGQTKKNNIVLKIENDDVDNDDDWEAIFGNPVNSIQFNLLKKFTGRTCCICEIDLLCNWLTKWCIPFIITWCPWQFIGKWCIQIVNRPSNYRIVIHSHVDVNQADCITDTCDAIKTKP